MSESLTEAAGRLAAILRVENAALTSLDFARAGTLLAAKHAAADALAVAFQASARETAALPALRELSGLADQNRLLLQRAMRVQRRVLDLVARAARGGVKPARYGATGKMTSEQAAPRSLAARA